MPQAELLQILLLHDHWATAQILSACDKLADDSFHQRFDIGPGSLHDTLTHIVGAMRTWTETLAGRELRPRLESDDHRRRPDELRLVLNESWEELAPEARRRPLGELVTRRTRDGRTFQITRAAVFAQITTHGMHHRAQCLNMLRQLGVHPLPPSSVAEWTWLAPPGHTDGASTVGVM